MTTSMKKIALLSILATAALASGQAMAVDATANATVLTPISITKDADLNFGNFFGALAGSVKIAPASAGTRTLTTVTAPASSVGTVGAAKFTVRGNVGTTYSVTLPADATVTLTGAGAAMPVNSFTSKLADGTTEEGTLSSNTEAFYVGAILTVNALQVAGAYTGNFAVSVAYN